MERHRRVSDADADAITALRRKRQNEPAMPVATKAPAQPPHDGFDYAAVDIVDIEDLAIACGAKLNKI